MSKKIRLTRVSMILMFVFVITVPIFASTENAAPVPEENENGIDGDIFNSQKSLTFAEGISFIVKGLELNPEEVEIEKELNPDQWITKEQFAHFLYQAMLATKVEFVVSEMGFIFTDDEQINPKYRNSIGALSNMGIVGTDSDGKFNPSDKISLADAAWMINRAITYLDPDKFIFDEVYEEQLKQLEEKKTFVDEFEVIKDYSGDIDDQCPESSVYAITEFDGHESVTCLDEVELTESDEPIDIKSEGPFFDKEDKTRLTE
ncbi:S-layer homology domain-containing protein [Chengkuizengella sp. SCS-71B]|uniref:S-layer homology domain-containing protein n=1 Tax=Chengkuizengella sp. SCS-71B TaxID=3115290 RepID=UPI0032C21E41